jgi:hypothetical protein
VEVIASLIDVQVVRVGEVVIYAVDVNVILININCILHNLKH